MADPVHAGAPGVRAATRADAAALGLPPLRGGERGVALTAGGRVVGVAVAGRHRRRLAPPVEVAVGPPGVDPEAHRGSVAWPPSSADAAARHRWAEADRRCPALVALEVVPGTGGDAVRTLLQGLATDLAAQGHRRLDVRLPAHDGRAAWFDGPGWYAGRVDGDLVVGRRLAAPGDRPGPSGRSRTVRRLRGLAGGGQLRDRAATLAEEAVRDLAERRWPLRRGARAAHPDAPAGASPHERTRFRIARRALALVPARSGAALLDVGCGDGRVLALADRLGLGPLAGIEVDPGLAAAAARRLPGARITAADATRTPLADDVATVFLFHPFGEEGTRALAAEVAASLRRRPRPLLVLYVNARHPEAFEDVGLTCRHEERHLSALTTPDPPDPPG